MAGEAVLRIKVITDATQAALGLDQTAANAGKFSTAMKKAALPAAAVGAAVVAMGKKAVDAASDLQQAHGAVEAVFGPELAGKVQKYANSAAKTMGLSAAEYENYAALVGTALQNAGFSAKQSVEESNKVMQRGADLSALYGGTTAEAVEAINAAVSRSEFDPLEKYGVSLNMTAVNAELAARGQDKLTGAAKATATKALILEKIYKDTGKAAGQYAREADSVAGQTQTMKAEWTNAAAALGEVLLPAVSDVVGLLGDFAKWAGKNKTTVQVLAGVVGGLAAAILLVNAGLKVMLLANAVGAAISFLGGTTAATAIGVYALAAAEWVAAAASTAFGVAMAILTSPITLVVAAIALLVGGLILLYKKSDTARAIMDAMWAGIKTGATAAWNAVKAAFNGILSAVKATYTWIRTNWPLLLAIITGPIGLAVLAIVKNWDRIESTTRALLSWLRDAFNNAWTAIKDMIGDRVEAMKIIIVRIKTKVDDVLEAVRDAFNTAWTAAKDLLSDRVEAMKIIIARIKDKLSDVVAYVRDTFNPIWATVQSKIEAVMSPIASAIGKVKSAITGVKDAVESLISALGRIKVPKISIPKIPGLGRSATPPPTGFAARTANDSAAPAVTGRASVGARSMATGGVNITVNGAIDPEATARQIQRILTGHGRRIAVAS